MKINLFIYNIIGIVNVFFSFRIGFNLLVIVFSIIMVIGCSRVPTGEIINSENNTENFDDIAKTFGSLDVNTSPDVLYRLFNSFSLKYFGAKTDSLYYHKFGVDLANKEEHSWIHISESSAVVAWETNLPANTYVEYGKTPALGNRTVNEERFFFNHVQYLRKLEPECRYYYRLVSLDERGNRLKSNMLEFYTHKIPGVIYIPGNLEIPPYTLDKSNTTYLVTQDIIAEGSAFDIKASGITLDLGGHTVVHANSLITKPDYSDIKNAGVGIRFYNETNRSSLKIYNGVIKQGGAKNNSDYFASEIMVSPDSIRKLKLDKNMNRGFSNIEIKALDDVEIAGVTSEYHLPQSWGMRFDDAFGSYNIHHNVFLDKGTLMFSRHGLGGARSMGFNGYDRGNLDVNGNDLKVHHNLIKRTRQNAINAAQEIFHNEIYVDSWVVNSFAIQPSKEKGNVYGNKMFLTGYYSCGVLWATKDLDVHDNFIHMESIKTMINSPNEGKRLLETWGEQDILAGMRVTNYNPGGTERENLTYKRNVILGRARYGAGMRGTEFFSDYSVKNLVFKDNIVKITTMDSITKNVADIDTQGSFNDRSTHLPIYYINNVLMSNICNIRFGDDYGQGSNHHFIDCKLSKIGDNSDYHTFIFSGKNSVFNHVLLDCDFEMGAKYDDVYWENTSSLSNYSIQWSLTLKTIPDAKVTIVDKHGNQSYIGYVDNTGIVTVPLTQCTIRPIEWRKYDKEIIVKEKSLHQKEVFSPYTVTIEPPKGRIQTRNINIDKVTLLDMTL